MKNFNLTPLWKPQLSLLQKMILLTSSLILITILLMGYYYHQQYSQYVEQHMGNRALSVAQSVAMIPELRSAFNEHSPEEIIQPIAEDIREEVGAQFIVVGNTDSIRYSHPIEERIGQKMVGGDNDPALLHGESYVSQAEGSLGLSIRGKVPVLSDEGAVIGVVSVGFLEDEVQVTAQEYISDTWILLAMITFGGLAGSVLISYHVKRSIHGLEPAEIGRMFEEKEAILQSIHEGIIAVNEQGTVTMINQTAMEYLSDKKNQKDVIGAPIQEIIKNTGLIEVLATGRAHFNKELWLQDHHLVVNRVPIKSQNKVLGAVSTFRNKTEIMELSRELSKVREYAEGLRAQTHEFSNKLYTISGLLQLGKVPEAIELIDQESKTQQGWLHFFIENVTDSMVSAVLLGKMNRAHELGITFSVDKYSQLSSVLTDKQREALITILGNLIENACESLLENDKKNRLIHVSFTDLGEEIVFEIEDSGPGVSPLIMEKIFMEGYSTKSDKHRGIGLALTMKAINNLGGMVTLEKSELGGACFIVSIQRLNLEE